jgi:hypothetical protein
MSRVARRLFLLASLGAVAFGGAGGCLSPTLPLPPPSKPDVEGPEQGTVTLSGRVQAGAMVFAANFRNAEVRGQIDLDGDGLYSFPIPADPGDELQLWYTVGTQQSPSIVFHVTPRER